MKKFWIIFIALAAFFGCARVRVEAPKEPIKLDISMRLDIYQHVAKDINAIEDIVSGNEKKPSGSKQGTWLDVFIRDAYAQESFGPEVEKAAYSRRDRKSELDSWEEKGVIGESKLGMVEIRGSADSSTKALIDAENTDRMVIYNAIATKNRISIEEVQKMYAKKLQDGANPGTPIETLNESTGQYEWKVK
nr:YdbL family protein [Candidatus Omnitrophota bacterium]